MGPGQGSGYHTNDMPYDLSGSHRNMSSSDIHRNRISSSSNQRNNDSLRSDHRTQISSNFDQNSNNVSYRSKASDSLRKSLKEMEKVKKMIDKNLEKSAAKPKKVCDL